jgi:hypothetical protein
MLVGIHARALRQAEMKQQVTVQMRVRRSLSLSSLTLVFFILPVLRMSTLR